MGSLDMRDPERAQRKRDGRAERNQWRDVGKGGEGRVQHGDETEAAGLVQHQLKNKTQLKSKELKRPDKCDYLA